jgi:hypothetical protein
MSDEVNGRVSATDDSLENFRFPIYRSIIQCPALFGVSVAEKARGHDAKADKRSRLLHRVAIAETMKAARVHFPEDRKGETEWRGSQVEPWMNLPKSRGAR